MGVQVPYTPSAHNDGLVVPPGVVIVGLAIWVVIACGLHRDESSAGPLGAAVVCFGLLFAATFTEGRVLPGWGASAGLRVRDLRPVDTGGVLHGSARPTGLRKEVDVAE